MRTLTWIRLTVFAGLAASVSTFAADSSSNEIKVVILSAKWCKPCLVLTAELKEKKVDKTISVQLKNGQKRALPFEIIDVSKEKDWDLQEAQFGKFVGVPTVQLRQGKKLIGGTRLDQFDRDPTVEDIKQFIIKELK